MTSPWHPIESAPKDGTPILACAGAYRGGLWPDGPITVAWQRYHPNSPGKLGWRDGSGHLRPYMTHWMPLPEGPSP